MESRVQRRGGASRRADVAAWVLGHSWVQVGEQSPEKGRS